MSKKHPFLHQTHVMGIVNVTPDSFSDGGHFLCQDKAIEHGLSLVQAGASILDVGGESTRPGAQPVDEKEEIRRIVPVIEGLKGCVPWISVDTRNAGTMEAALRGGANLINDVSALQHDSRSIAVIKEAQVPVVLMHMKGAPQNMQENPLYNNVVGEVLEFLKERIAFCEMNRLDADMLLVDPGIGFGKNLEDNLLLLRHIKEFHALECPVVLGASRKSFIGKLSGDVPTEERLAGSLATALWGLSQGVQIFRVHDVKETLQAFSVYQSISGFSKTSM